MVFAQYSFLQPINIYSFLIHRMSSSAFDRYLNADNLRVQFWYQHITQQSAIILVTTSNIVKEDIFQYHTNNEIP